MQMPCHGTYLGNTLHWNQLQPTVPGHNFLGLNIPLENLPRTISTDSYCWNRLRKTQPNQKPVVHWRTSQSSRVRQIWSLKRHLSCEEGWSQWTDNSTAFPANSGARSELKLQASITVDSAGKLLLGANTDA